MPKKFMGNNSKIYAEQIKNKEISLIKLNSEILEEMSLIG